jgi:hypothetical protein
MSNTTVSDVFKALVDTTDLSDPNPPAPESGTDMKKHGLPGGSLRISFYSDAVIAID